MILSNNSFITIFFIFPSFMSNSILKIYIMSNNIILKKTLGAKNKIVPINQQRNGQYSGEGDKCQTVYNLNSKG